MPIIVGIISQKYLLVGVTMDKNLIMQILSDWNFWKKDLPCGIGREGYIEKLKTLMPTGQIIVITGPRRAGKSFVMRQLVHKLISGVVQRENILMINFEDPRFENLDAGLLQRIYETYLEYLRPSSKPYIFLDEVQEVEDWEKWVRTAHELNKATIILSGSNAKLLSRELSTLLTGRHIDLSVFPLSFAEYLFFNEIDISGPLDLVDKKIELSRAINDFLEFGSFPLTVISDEKKEILLSYYDDVINKDLIRRFKVRKPADLKALARFYLSNTSSLVTFNSIEKFLKVSADTIDKFSGYLEEAYLIFLTKRFSFKVKEQEKSPRKVYVVDTGLANIVGFKSSPNKGRLAETVVFLELARMRAKGPEIEIYYWKDERHKEVDFVIMSGSKVSSLIQVCWDVQAPETKNRELKALLKAMNEFHLNEGIVISEDYEAIEDYEGKKIIFIPLYKWLLKHQLPA